MVVVVLGSLVDLVVAAVKEVLVELVLEALEVMEEQEQLILGLDLLEL
jgi:hypothetical protein